MFCSHWSHGAMWVWRFHVLCGNTFLYPFCLLWTGYNCCYSCTQTEMGQVHTSFVLKIMALWQNSCFHGLRINTHLLQPLCDDVPTSTFTKNSPWTELFGLVLAALPLFVLKYLGLQCTGMEFYSIRPVGGAWVLSSRANSVWPWGPPLGLHNFQ